jgi:hypothetical protein
MRFIGNAPVDGEVRAIASGALATGDTVVVNADGTVSVIAGTSADQAIGTAATYESGATNWPSATFDSNTNKVFVAYEDDATSDYGRCVVGTVDPSDNSITFGSPVTFNSSATTYTTCCFDTNANKVVLVYKDDSPGYHIAKVGTISGTSVSFGGGVNIFTNVAYQLDCCFDSTNNKVFVCGRDNNASGTGRELYGVVGTVSGTSISFGSFATIGNANQTPSDISCCYDSSNDRIVVAWRNVDDSSKGYAAVGQISGTDVSFGTAAIFVNSLTSQSVDCAFDSNANKVVIVYADGGNSSKGTATVCDINTSNNAISFNTAVVFSTAAGARPSAVFDSNAGKIVIAYSDFNNSWYGNVVTGTVVGTSITFDTPTVIHSNFTYYNSITFDSNSNKVVIALGTPLDGGISRVFQTGYSTTNLTSENFVGFANSGYASGQSAAINSTCMVDSNQTSLTAGQTYYVQTSGALGTTPADPSVVAGTAISSNSIIVKG